LGNWLYGLWKDRKPLLAYILLAAVVVVALALQNNISNELEDNAEKDRQEQQESLIRAGDIAYIGCIRGNSDIRFIRAILNVTEEELEAEADARRAASPDGTLTPRERAQYNAFKFAITRAELDCVSQWEVLTKMDLTDRDRSRIRARFASQSIEYNPPPPGQPVRPGRSDP
jgi:hypothetical protein